MQQLASQYVESANLIEIIKENLVAERIACEQYRELIRFFADKRPDHTGNDGKHSDE